MWQNITIEKMLENIKADSNSVVVDVRTEKEWRGIGLPIVENIETLTNTVVHPPYMLTNEFFLNNLLSDVSKDSSVYFICRSGQRSQISSQMAYENGYKAYNIVGGMIEWVEKNMPIIDYDI